MQLYTEHSNNSNGKSDISKKESITLNISYSVVDLFLCKTEIAQ